MTRYKYLGRYIKLQMRSNGFRWRGHCIDETDTFITIEDAVDGKVHSFNLEELSYIEVQW